MNKTTNYQLNQWVKDDQVRMEDFNADNAKIDAAIKAEANARTAGDAALSTRVDGLSAGKVDTSEVARLEQLISSAAAKAAEEHIYVGGYMGDGNKARVVRLPWEPKFMVLIGYVNSEDAIFMFTQETAAYIQNSVNSTSTFIPKLQGSSLTFHHENWGNNSEKTMYYILFR